jgi:predicted DCC family thiol-disulfide oxidoreductase YuxK
MTPNDQARITGHPVILYDGVCALCNFVVRYLLRHDHAGQFLFVPQETPLAAELLAPYAASNAPEGVILLTATLTPGQRLYRRTDAVSESLRLLAGPWSFLGRLARITPRWLREPLYTLIARYRYRLFGRYSTCPIPTPAQQERILGLHPAS